MFNETRFTLMFKSVIKMAMHDIALALPPIIDRHEIWFIRPTHLETRENRELNRRLGLHKVNK